MATPRSTMGADARPIHPALVKSVLSANAAEAEVRAAAEYLMEAMRRIQIDHESEFVTVALRRPKGRATPNREVA